MALSAVLAWLFAGALVTVVVQIDGPNPSGRTVSATGEAGSAQAVTDADGRAKLALPPDARLLLRIDGRDAGEVHSPAEGYRASVAIPWPPAFTVRLRGSLPDPRFRAVPLDAAGEARELRLDEGALRVDWLLPGDRFDLYASAGADDWLWYAGPFLVEANAEETVVLHPARHIALRDLAAPETQRVLDVVAPQLDVYLAAHPDVELSIAGAPQRASRVREALVKRGVPANRIAAPAPDGERSADVEIRIESAASVPAAPSPETP